MFIIFHVNSPYFNRKNKFHFVNCQQNIAKEIKSINLVLEYTFRSDDLLEQMFAHMGVHRAERIIQKVYIGVLIHRTRHTDTLLLSPTQINPLVKDRQG